MTSCVGCCIGCLWWLVVSCVVLLCFVAVNGVGMSILFVNNYLVLVLLLFDMFWLLWFCLCLFLCILFGCLVVV